MANKLEWAFFIFIAGTILSCICTGRWLLNGEINIINSLASFRVAEFSAAGGMSAPTGISAWWNAAVTALTWDYPFLDGSWAFFFKIPLLVISLGAIVEFMIVVAIPLFQGIVNAVRNIFG